MPETITFGEIEALPLNAGWQYPTVIPGENPAIVPLPGGHEATFGPEPGYSVTGRQPWEFGSHDYDGDPRDLTALSCAGPAEIRHVFYGAVTLPPGTWRLRLRNT